jgi:hypothetical protein
MNYNYLERMNDGRAFTDYRPRGTLDDIVRYNNHISNNYDYRQFLIHNGQNNNNLYEDFDDSSDKLDTTIDNGIVTAADDIDSDIVDALDGIIEITCIVYIFAYYLLIFGQYMILDGGIADIFKKHANSQDTFNKKFFKKARDYFYKYWNITKKRLMNTKKEHFENENKKALHGYNQMLYDFIDAQAAISANLYYVAVIAVSTVFQGKVNDQQLVNVAEKYLFKYWNILDTLTIDKIKKELDDAKKKRKKIEEDHKKKEERRRKHHNRNHEKKIASTYKESVSNINETINSYGEDITTLFCGN